MIAMFFVSIYYLYLQNKNTGHGRHSQKYFNQKANTVGSNALNNHVKVRNRAFYPQQTSIGSGAYIEPQLKRIVQGKSSNENKKQSSNRQIKAYKSIESHKSSERRLIFKDDDIPSPNDMLVNTDGEIKTNRDMNRPSYKEIKYQNDESTNLVASDSLGKSDEKVELASNRILSALKQKEMKSITAKKTNKKVSNQGSNISNVLEPSWQDLEQEIDKLFK